MVTYGIDAKVTGFAEGELSKPSDKFVAASHPGHRIYNGPCTPPNVQPHHYTFVLIATDYDTMSASVAHDGLSEPGAWTDETIAAVAPATAWAALRRWTRNETAARHDQSCRSPAMITPLSNSGHVADVINVKNERHGKFQHSRWHAACGT